MVLMIAFALFLWVALFSYHPQDSAWSIQNNQPVQNLTGPFGAMCADLLFSFVGALAYLVPAILCLLIWAIHKSRDSEHRINPIIAVIHILGAMLFFLAGSALADISLGQVWHYLPQGAGGIFGAWFVQVTEPYLNPVGAALSYVALILVALTLLVGLVWVKVFRQALVLLFNGFKRFCKGFHHVFHYKKPQDGTVQSIKASKIKMESPLEDEPIPDLLNVPVESDDLFDQPTRPKAPLKIIKPIKASDLNEGPQHAEPTGLAKVALTGEIPSIDLLDPAEEVLAEQSSEQLEQTARLLEQKLLDFGVKAEVVGVCPGPVITRYELNLAPGVKASKLTGLARDLARALSAVSVRVVEVIPGKSVVGVEIPNDTRQMVRLSEVLDSQLFQNHPSALCMGLGKDIAGEPEVVDLGKMPHLLVAGTTGSGKSVGLNAMILSLLLKTTPNELRLIMIDPKMLELSIYEGIPHLLTPVVTDMKQASNALRWCVKEMDRRYLVMSKLGVRNIAGLNEKVAEAKKTGEILEDPIWRMKNPDAEGAPEALESMPYVVVVVDEFADMMMVVGKKVEELIARIAQKARAAGIHLILATQRPSVDVITGLIKANIPSRMAFQVSSKIDSRTVIDQMGAEQLLGHGDMLYLPPGTSIPTRVHGAFVADHEVHKVVEAWRQLGEPHYVESILNTESLDEDAANAKADENGDPLYQEAINIVLKTQRASISSVQRRLKIGYNRAARLIEQMEEDGIVGEMQTSGLRDILVSQSED